MKGWESWSLPPLLVGGLSELRGAPWCCAGSAWRTGDAGKQSWSSFLLSWCPQEIFFGSTVLLTWAPQLSQSDVRSCLVADLQGELRLGLLLRLAVTSPGSLTQPSCLHSAPPPLHLKGAS